MMATVHVLFFSTNRKHGGSHAVSVNLFADACVATGPSMPSIGHGTDKRRKHVLQNGFKKVLINNVRVSLGRTCFFKV